MNSMSPVRLILIVISPNAGPVPLNMPRSAAEENLMDEWMSAARDSLSESEWAQAYAAGADLAPEPAIELVQAVGVGERR